MNIKAEVIDDVMRVDIDGTIGGYDYENDKMNTASRIKKELAEMKKRKCGSVEVRINSLGGYVSDGVAIFEALHEISDNVTTTMVGHCASAATIVAMGGKKRCMSKYALMLVHRSWSLAEGNVLEMQEQMQELEAIDAQMVEIYSNVTGQDKKKVCELMDENQGRGKWITAEEALEMGFITDIVDGAAAKNDLLRTAMACAGYPEMPEGYMAEGVVEPKNFINKEQYMKIQEKYARVGAALPEAEIDKKGNATLTAEMLEELEAKMENYGKSLEEAAEGKSKAEAERDEAKKALAEKEGEVAELKALLEKAEANAARAQVQSQEEQMSAWDEYVKKNPDVVAALY